MNHLTRASVDREAVLVSWLRHYDRHLNAITTECERAEFLDEVRAASATLGRNVRVERSDGFFEGRAIAIADDGQLLVDCGGDGGVVAVTVGDIVHARLLG